MNCHCGKIALYHLDGVYGCSDHKPVGKKNSSETFQLEKSLRESRAAGVPVDDADLAAIKARYGRAECL